MADVDVSELKKFLDGRTVEATVNRIRQLSEEIKQEREVLVGMVVNMPRNDELLKLTRLCARFSDAVYDWVTRTPTGQMMAKKYAKQVRTVEQQLREISRERGDETKKKPAKK